MNGKPGPVCQPSQVSLICLTRCQWKYAILLDLFSNVLPGDMVGDSELSDVCSLTLSASDRFVLLFVYSPFHMVQKWEVKWITTCNHYVVTQPLSAQNVKNAKYAKYVQKIVAYLRKTYLY